MRSVSRSSVAKWPDSGATSSTAGCVGLWEGMSFLKCSRVPNGAVIVTSSVTATSSPPDTTEVMPYGGREWVSRMRENTSIDAAILLRDEGVSDCGSSADMPISCAIRVLPACWVDNWELVIWAHRRSGDIRSD